MTAMAQVKGNGEVISKAFDIIPINKFELNMYADVILDASMSSKVIINAESNLIDKIDFEVVNGVLNLQQKEWIQSTRPIQITIGVPSLKNVEVGSNETLRVVNLNQDQLALTALIGKIEAEGSVGVLNLNAERGIVDASELEAKTVQLNIWNAGKVVINATEEVRGDVDKNAKIKFVKEPKIVASNIKKLYEKKGRSLFRNAEYISFKIKNNSWNRNQFAVKGPKVDGTFFGYGFPMMPGAVKKERWTVGTKVYKVNKLGVKKLLVEIKKENEGQVINLFD